MNNLSDTPQEWVKTQRLGATLVVMLNNPARRNSITREMLAALQNAFAEQEHDSTIRAVILTGAGGHFCSGGDLKGMDATRGSKRDQFTNSQMLARQISGASVPVIAAVDGWAAGAGFSLALLADTVVAARDAGFVASFPKVGLIPDYGMLETLPARIGMGKAKQILLYGQIVKAPEAHDLGIVDHLCEPGATLETALGLADQVSQMAPRAVRAIKDYYGGNITRALDFERIIQPELILGQDAAEGRAAFAEKRTPEFKDE